MTRHVVTLYGVNFRNYKGGPSARYCLFITHGSLDILTESILESTQFTSNEFSVV